MHGIKRSHDGAGRTRSLAGGTLKRILLLTSLIVGLAAVSSIFAAAARADTVGPITFEPTAGYVLGNINGQQGWMKTGAYDVNVASVAAFPAAAKYGFGSPGAATVGRGHQRELRRPDVLARPAEPGRRVPGHPASSMRGSRSARRRPPCSPACTCR